jgi:hypothetical protein
LHKKTFEAVKELQDGAAHKDDLTATDAKVGNTTQLNTTNKTKLVNEFNAQLAEESTKINEMASIASRTILNFDIDKASGKNAADPLIIQAYTRDDDAVHLSVVHMPNGWNDYKYWMTFTPYEGAITK